MPTRNVVLTDRQAAAVERLVASGRYQNASEVLRAGLRLLEQREAEDAAKLAALREAHLSVFWSSVAFLLALFGFGAKAGLLPLHVWLPEAHPAAPSPVSALMSGIMLKTAIYGILRVTFDLLANSLNRQQWW